ncbi:hypothetical protein ACFVUS_20745 [Nocardia sp. NPDC058058]|uniref:hypothetical protein n=1 Tax=Nocardia sp. NPDC058058 TaxID=3346317 RepID=UPI0036DE9814
MPMIVVTGGDSFVPSGMNKVAPAQPLTNSMTEIPGWTADPGSPGSLLSGNALRNQGSRAAATITANLVFSGAQSATTTHQARIFVNGIGVGNTPSVTAAAGTLVATATLPLADGDLVTVQATGNATLSAWNASIQVAGSTVRIA